MHINYKTQLIFKQKNHKPSENYMKSYFHEQQKKYEKEEGHNNTSTGLKGVQRGKYGRGEEGS